MSWTGSADALPSVRIAALAPSLQPTEKRVADAILADIEGTIERSAQELAEHAGAGRASVIRTAQTLGYDGYPQLRVALARELALEASRQAPPPDGTVLGALRKTVQDFAARLDGTVAALTEDEVQRFLTAVDSAKRVLVVANGLSAPLGLDIVLRLNSMGRPAEYLPDALAQEIAAKQLGEGSVCLAVSGSGVNRSTLAVMAASKASGATAVAITSFARSAVAELADVALIIPPVHDSFRQELLQTSRAALMLMVESLVGLLIAMRGQRGADARSATLSVLSRSLDE